MRFYNGEEKSKEETAKLIKGANMLNLAGEEAVNLGIKEGLVSKEHIIKIKKIPHAQVVMG